MLFKFSPVMESNVRPVSVDNFLKAYHSIEIGAICNIESILFSKFCYVYSPGHVTAYARARGYNHTRFPAFLYLPTRQTKRIKR